MELNERPAIELNAGWCPLFIHATDANGDSWGPLIDLNGSESRSVSDFQNCRSSTDCPRMFYHLADGNAHPLKDTPATVQQFKVD